MSGNILLLLYLPLNIKLMEIEKQGEKEFRSACNMTCANYSWMRGWTKANRNELIFWLFHLIGLKSYWNEYHHALGIWTETTPTFAKKFQSLVIEQQFYNNQDFAIVNSESNV